MSDSEKIGEQLAAIEDGSATIADADGLALQLADQNARYKEATDILAAEPEVLELVQFGIADEQEETFANIISMAPESGRVFESLGRLSLYIEKSLASVEAQVKTMNTTVKEQEAALDEMSEQKKQQELLKTEELLANVERLAPRAVESVKELLESRGSNIVSDQEINDLEDAVLELMDQEHEAEEDLKRIKGYSSSLDAVVGQLALSWELPVALVDQNRSLFITLDELPVEPDIADCPSGEVQQFAERHVDQPKAAILSAQCLSEHAGETVTVDQIARLLYSPEVISQLNGHKLRSRVTSTLGPKFGENLRSILDEEGFVLQYGWRRTLEQKPDGSIGVKLRHRIYRAIEKDQIADFMESNSFEGDGFTDSFEALHTPVVSDIVEAESSAEPSEPTVVFAEINLPPESVPEAEAMDEDNDDISLVTESGSETHSQRKERLKNELLSAITGSARSIIKIMGEHGAIEEAGIKLGHLKGIYFATEISDEDFRNIVGSRVSPNDSYWLRSTDAVRLLLSVTLEDESVRTSASSKQWRRVVNEKIDELIQRELRGIDRRKKLQAK
ncbi:hypothetical protein KBD20_01345 [Candidatus Saccharibacteria bacterium]|nr:hypothetical protein [Candidatus Saccharibacteria bacterium]